MKFGLILVIALAIIVGQLLSKKYLAMTPKEEVIKKTTSGDPVRDFMDNY